MYTGLIRIRHLSVRGREPRPHWNAIELLNVFCQLPLLWHVSTLAMAKAGGLRSVPSLPKIAHGRSTSSLRSPYMANLRASVERSEDLAKARSGQEERQRRDEDRMRERLRRQVLQAAFEEAQQQAAPIEAVALLEQQKRLRALDSVNRVAERNAAARLDIRRRFYEPTPEQTEQREAEWQRRRMEHAKQRETRKAAINAVSAARAALLSTASDLRLRQARERAGGAPARQRAAS